MSVVKGSGVERIAEERRRQTAEEHWGPDGDDLAVAAELGRAAIAYTLSALGYQIGGFDGRAIWPWETRTFKPGDPIRDLEKAGALIAAEIDRLVRKKERELREAFETIEVRRRDIEAVSRWILANDRGGPAEVPGGLPSWVREAHARLFNVLKDAQ